MVGRVNAARGHFQMTVDDLSQAQLRWGAHVEGLITNHYPFDRFGELVGNHPPDAIKEVIEWAQ